MKQKFIEICGEKFVVDLNESQSNYRHGCILLEGCPVATVSFFNGEIEDAPKALTRAMIAIRSFRKNQGKWSYLGDEDEQPRFTLLEALDGLDEHCKIFRHNHFREHWCFERWDYDPFFRFLIWDPEMAARIEAEIAVLCTSCTTSSFSMSCRKEQLK